MATLCFFDEEIKDQGGKNQMSMEFGRSSFYPEDSVYFTINGETVIVDQATAKRITNAMADCASYLSLDK